MDEICRMSAAAIAGATAARRLSAAAVAEAHFRRIEAAEPRFRSFAHLDPERVRAEAARIDATDGPLPLRGVPVAVKDIVDVAGWPAECGSPIYRGRRPDADADCVAALRDAGALVIGKAVTTEFAGRHPGPTANPRDPARTPGGSSSGSAAAVAAGCAPLAIGTQTGGSVIRPASYCGIAGWKSSLGGLSVVGVKPLWLGFDALGLFARGAADLLLFGDVLAGTAEPPPPAPAVPRIALVETPAWPEAEPAMRALHAAAGERLAAAGCRVERLALPALFDELPRAQEIVSTWGIARSFEREWATSRHLLSPSFRGIIERGLGWSEAETARAWSVLHRCADLLPGIFAGRDALLLPAAAGEAPVGLADTGSAAFNAIWTTLGPPAVTLPFGTGPAGLPLGLQLMGPRGADRALLALAVELERRLGIVIEVAD